MHQFKEDTRRYNRPN